MDEYYERHLPHQIPEGFPIFLTWNLKGAMPRYRIEELIEERRRLEGLPAKAGESPSARKLRINKILFGLSDRILDAATEGPLDLREPANADLVQAAIIEGSQTRYDLLAWCVMPNHVHALLIPRQKLSVLMQCLKGGTSYRINLRQNERGRTFWQDESYDHWARDEEEMHRIIDYIERNPVAANLCRSPEEWLWSSARLRATWERGQPYVKVGQASA